MDALKHTTRALRPAGRVCTALMLIVFTYFGLAKGGGGLPVLLPSDLALHFAGYLVLAATVRFSFIWHTLAIVSGLFAYSFVIEVIQHFIPTRFFDLWDLLANLCGILAGTAIGVLVNRWVG